MIKFSTSSRSFYSFRFLFSSATLLIVVLHDLRYASAGTYIDPLEGSNNETVPIWPPPFDNATDLQPGFTPGIPSEIVGLWIGDEKYREINETGQNENIITQWCTQAAFNPNSGLSEFPYGFQSWMGTNSTCEDAGVYPKNGIIDSRWLQNIMLPVYIAKITQWACLPDDECLGDPTKDDDSYDNIKFQSWSLEAKSCSVSLNLDLTDAGQYYQCYKHQVALLSKAMDDGSMKYQTVLTLNYRGFQGGYQNYQCGPAPSYLTKNIPNVDDEGVVRFVLQQPYEGSNNVTNPCNWKCYTDDDNKFNCDDHNDSSIDGVDSMGLEDTFERPKKADALRAWIP